MLEGCKKKKHTVAIYTGPTQESVPLKAKYGKILPELADPDDRGPSGISEATEDKNEMLLMLKNPIHPNS